MCLKLVTISYVSMSFLKTSLACKNVFFFFKRRASKQSSWLVHILSWLWCLSNILLNPQSGPIQLRFPCLAIFIIFTIGIICGKFIPFDSSESCECYERWRIFIPFSLQSMCLYPCQPTQLLPALTPILHTSTFLYPSYRNVRKGPSLPHKYNSICLLH